MAPRRPPTGEVALILPLRQDPSGVRRWPWFGFGITALGAVAFLLAYSLDLGAVLAHIGAFLLGAGLMALLCFSLAEKHWVDADVESKDTLLQTARALEDAARLRHDGDNEGAWARLRQAIEESPDDHGASLALWDLATATGRTHEAAPAMARAVEAAAHAGEVELAAEQWEELTANAPSALCDAACLVRILPQLQKAGANPELVVRALRHIVDPANDTLTPGLATRTIELARELDPPSALRAAQRALTYPELHEKKRTRVQEQIAELEAAGVVPAPPVEASSAPHVGPKSDPSTGELPETHVVAKMIETGVPEQTPTETPVPHDGVQDLEPEFSSSAGSESEEAVFATEDLDLDALTAREVSARFHDVKVAEGRPTALDDRAIRFGLPGGRIAKLALSKIQALAVGVVAGLGPKPILVIDIALNWNAIDEPQLRVVRLRSNAFDPRRLVSGETDAKRALQTLLQRLAAAPGVTALPDAQAILGRPFARFESLEAYEREVLEIEG